MLQAALIVSVLSLFLEGASGLRKFAANLSVVVSVLLDGPKNHICGYSTES